VSAAGFRFVQAGVATIVHTSGATATTAFALLPGEGEMMLSNRSIPRATVIPVLAYPDVTKAAAWLCDAFGFNVRLRIGNHRVQLNVGDGAVWRRAR